LPAIEEAKLYVKKLHNNKGNSKEGKGDTQAKPGPVWKQSYKEDSISVFTFLFFLWLQNL
jgi:hypothetical protein